jgi:hypothetical protein
MSVQAGGDSARNRDTITVEEILDQYHEWGIPHFQRGSVWGSDNVSALLESLYYDTPCGSIILWTPEDTGSHGVPLVPGGRLTHLIIDGQQRTRSVYAAFKGLFDETSDETDENGEGPSASEPEDGHQRCWAINLHELPAFDDLLGAAGKRVWPLFVSIPDPRQAEARPQLRRNNCVPLECLIDGDWKRLLEQRRFFLKGTFDLGRPTDVSRVAARLDGVRRNVEAMKSRRLFRRVLEQNVNLNAALQVFRRINSGGRPVQEEEKGFSILVGKAPSTSTWVKGIFGLVHGDGAAMGTLDLARDEALRRMNEREFGFRLFIRVFMLAVTYHADRAFTGRGLSFAILRDRRFLSAVRGDAAAYDRLWSITADAVVAMRRVLAGRVWLDALRFLPDSTSLHPLFLWLIRFPGALEGTGGDVRLRPEFEARFARLALLLLLLDPTKQQLIRWLSSVARDQRDAGAMLDRLGEMIGVPDDVLDRRLESANSLMNRYTLLLYALQRSRGACDFHYGINELSGPLFDDKAPRPIAEEHRPEKQHIVPYSSLSEAYDLEGRSRVSSSEVNNIGNITYISAAQNGLDGLASALLRLEEEEEGNRRAHVVSSEGLAAFGRVRDLLASERRDLGDIRRAYESWTGARRRDIRRAFLDWCEELRQEPLHLEGNAQVAKRVDPVPPMLAQPTVPYLIRVLELPDALEEVLISLFETGWEPQAEDGAPSPIGGPLVLFLRRHNRKVVRGVELSSTLLVVPAKGDRPEIRVDLTDAPRALEQLRALPEEFEARAEAPREKGGKGEGQGSRVRTKVTRDEWLACIASVDPGVVPTAETLIDIATELGGDAVFGDAAVSVRIRNPVTRKPCTLYVVTCRGTFYIRSLSKWEKNANVLPDLGLSYERELTGILGRNPRQVPGDRRGAEAMPLRDVAPRLERLLAVVQQYAVLLHGGESMAAP